MTEAVEVVRPDPDSHFRLLPCKVCQSEDVCYEYRPWGWLVRCQACGHTLDIGTHIRHEAQVAWNKENKNVKTESIRIV